jgi:hypothetical protein
VVHNVFLLLCSKNEYLARSNKIGKQEDYIFLIFFYESAGIAAPPLKTDQSHGCGPFDSLLVFRRCVLAGFVIPPPIPG